MRFRLFGLSEPSDSLTVPLTEKPFRRPPPIVNLKIFRLTSMVYYDTISAGNDLQNNPNTFKEAVQ